MDINDVIAAQTGAAQSRLLSSGPSGSATLVVSSSGGDLAGAEVVDLEYTTDSGTTWKTMNISGGDQRLDSSNNIITVTVPVPFRVNKSVTAASVGVTLIS